jgi:autoinducer 2-degrading protein
VHILIVRIQIQPERKADFIREMLGDSKGSRNDEPGCLRFDVIQDEANPNQIFLYEVYKDKAAFDYHTQQPHMTKWRDAVKSWYAEPTVVFRGYNIDPPDAEWK